tara:strand:- start:3269 stop:3634 length:366 start_codon:yes stop_codon:yes gene_type:complete
MATKDLINARIKVDSSKDNVIIDKVIETIRGGRTLDITGFPDKVIQAGHVIILEDGEFKPQPVDGSKATLAVGVLTVSILAEDQLASIMTRGTVNEVPLKYPITAATKTALGAKIGYVITD